MDFDVDERVELAQRSMLVACFIYLITSLLIGLYALSVENLWLIKLSIGMYAFFVVTVLTTILFLEKGSGSSRALMYMSYAMTFPVTLLTFLILLPFDILRRIYWKIKLAEGGDDYYDT